MSVSETAGGMGLLPQPGHIFERKYRILNLIGAGGFAQVYHAEFEDVGRHVAIKILTPHEGLGSVLYPMEIDQRFLREATMLSELRDPHTVIMHDFGRAESGLLYMVFEYIDGLPLNRLVKENGPQSPKLVKRVIEQVLMSLREAHSKGILHRDLKPANIMVYEYLGDPTHTKLLDFGIAKPLQAEKSHELTQDGTMMGTPRYMSPEQICGQQMGAAADIYSLGLCAYELLVGQPAIGDTTSPTIVRRQLSGEEFPLPANVPIALRQVIDKMTKKILRERYQTVDEVLEDLRQVTDAQLVADSTLEEAYDDATELLSNPAQTAGAWTAPSQTQQGWGAPAPLQTAGRSERITSPFEGSGSTPQQVAKGGWAAASPADPTVHTPSGGLQSSPQGFAHPNPAMPAVRVAKPQDCVVSVDVGPTGIAVDFPARITKQGVMILGGASMLLFLVISMSLWALLLPAFAAGVFALGFILRSAHLVIDLNSGMWRVTRKFLVYEQAREGPIQEVVCVREERKDEQSTLKLVTQNKVHPVASDYSPGEFAWVVGEVTNYLNKR